MIRRDYPTVHIGDEQPTAHAIYHILVEGTEAYQTCPLLLEYLTSLAQRLGKISTEQGHGPKCRHPQQCCIQHIRAAGKGLRPQRKGERQGMDDGMEI